MIGRGTSNSKGPELALLERAHVDQGRHRQAAGQHRLHRGRRRKSAWNIGLRKFVKDHPDFFKNIDALIGEGGDQAPSGGAGVGGGSEGCVYSS